MTDDAPPFSLDIVHPKVVKRFVPVPPAKEIDVTVVGVDAHGVATPFRGCVAIGVNTVQAPPLSVWLAGLEVGLEEACGGGLDEEGFGVVPVALENESGVERRHDGVLELDLGTGEDGLVGSQKASFAEVLEDLTEDDRFAVLEMYYKDRLGYGELGTDLVITHANTLNIRRLRDSRDSDIPDGYVKTLPMCPVPQSTRW